MAQQRVRGALELAQGRRQGHSTKPGGRGSAVGLALPAATGQFSPTGNPYGKGPSLGRLREPEMKGKEKRSIRT